MVALQQRIQASFENKVTTIEPKSDPREAIEDTFLLKIYDRVCQDLSDATLEIPQLAKELGLSRSQLFRKTKALTGYSPASFIRKIRVQKGKQFLLSTELSIAEIAFETGFSSPNYFSDSFYAEYGMRPTEMRYQQN